MVMARPSVTRSPRSRPSIYSRGCKRPRRRPRAVASDTRQIARQNFEDLLRAARNYGTRSEDSGCTRLIQILVVLRRDHTADDDENVIAPDFAEFGDDFGNQCL